MQQRYYDPSLGRFLSVDPVTANPNTGTNFNRYWYANNNPYKFTDPDGRRSVVRGGNIYIQPEDKTVPALPPIQNNVGATGVSPTDKYFHQYEGRTASNLTPQQAGEGFRNDPTPGTDRAASPNGTINDAGFIMTNTDNMVRSYAVQSPDPAKFTDVTVNYTISGQHELTEGFVVRFGQINQDGSVTMRSYGEGNNWRQGGALTEPVATPAAEFLWERNHQDIIQSAGGQ